MIFEWDENKNHINQRKHGISFEEAQTVFEDTYAILFDDPGHSDHIRKKGNENRAPVRTGKT